MRALLAVLALLFSLSGAVAQPKNPSENYLSDVYNACQPVFGKFSGTFNHFEQCKREGTEFPGSSVEGARAYAQSVLVAELCLPLFEPSQPSSFYHGCLNAGVRTKGRAGTLADAHTYLETKYAERLEEMCSFASLPEGDITTTSSDASSPLINPKQICKEKGTLGRGSLAEAYGYALQMICRNHIDECRVQFSYTVGSLTRAAQYMEQIKLEANRSELAVSNQQLVEVKAELDRTNRAVEMARERARLCATSPKTCRK